MEPDALIATKEYGEIYNPNLYFGSWASFIMSFLVCVGILREKAAHCNKGTNAAAFQMEAWAFLCLTSFVTMMAATRLYDDEGCDDNNSSDFCKRTTFALSLGATSALLSGVWFFVGATTHHQLKKMVDTVAACLLLGAWSFGIAYILFGNEHPATFLGNLYFFTLASFGTACHLGSSAIFCLVGSMWDKTTNTDDKGADKPDEKDKDMMAKVVEDPSEEDEVVRMEETA
jgi:hypothetical protein